MRRISKKRQKRIEEVSPVRKALIEKHGRCMWCHGRPTSNPESFTQLCCHEIARGVYRDKALDKPYAILVLCHSCHMHRIHGNEHWPEARQLKLLQRESPEDYDLEAYNYLINPRAPNRITQEEVDNEEI